MLQTRTARFFTPLSLISGLAVLTLGACADSPSAPTIAPSAPALAKAPAAGPYSGVFADGSGDKVRSDGRGPYVEAESGACTASWGYPGSGLYQLRTIRNSVCKSQPRGTWRYFTIDFGAPVVDLDQDGIAEAIEEAPGRLMASSALAVRATSTSVTIRIFQVLPPPGTTTEDDAWVLTFNAPVPVSGSGVRVLQALPGNAAVTITNAAGVSVTVNLPFKLTLTPQ